MSIASEITRLQTAKADIKTAIEAKGVSVPSNATLSTYDDYVSQITGGGGGGGEKVVKFYDYDGTLLYSYTLAEAQALEALPELPTAPFDYTADSWTETLAFVKALTKPWNIGVNYTTTRTGTEIDIEVPETDKTVYVYLGDVGNTVNWGDGTTDTATVRGAISHTYATSGKKTVTLDVGSSGYTAWMYLMGMTLNPHTGSTAQSAPVVCLSSEIYSNQNIKTSIITGVRQGTKGWSPNDYCLASTSLEYMILCPSAYTSSIGTSISYLSNSSLPFISIPSTVTSLSNKAFQGCSSLQSIIIHSRVTSIGGSAFSSCTSLQSITIGSGVTSIGGNAFEYCSSLQSITIPDGVTSIGNYTFQYCSSLQSITIGSGVTSIGGNAFESCSSLQSVTIPDGVTSIGTNAFKGCFSLQSVTIPDGVTSIGNSAFNGCSSLQSIVIPDSVTRISDSIFAACRSLQSITIPSSVTSIRSNAFETCYSLQNVTIGSGVTSIWDSTFYFCSSLQSITIPSSVTSIGDSTFYFCRSLHSVTIGSGVTNIGSSAFYNCNWLNEVHVEATTPPTLGSGVFSSNYSTRKIYVPYSADHSVLAAYKAANNWSAYADYIEEEPQA